MPLLPCALPSSYQLPVGRGLISKQSWKYDNRLIQPPSHPSEGPVALPQTTALCLDLPGCLVADICSNLPGAAPAHAAAGPRGSRHGTDLGFTNYSPSSPAHRGRGSNGRTAQYELYRAAERTVFSARSEIIRKLFHLPIRDYDVRRSGDLVSRVGTDTTMLRAVITSGVIELLGSIIVIVGAVVVLISIDFPLLLTVLAVLTLSGVTALVLGGRMQKLALRNQEEIGQMAAAVERGIGGRFAPFVRPGRLPQWVRGWSPPWVRPGAVAWSARRSSGGRSHPIRHAARSGRALTPTRGCCRSPQSALSHQPVPPL
ncbi:MAG: hypothetical protein B5766_11720 [Candidatus Lumbricidophila eiseniae]|uniref:ABC transmembrane type-1 domain-containing protein n=1 Tax=Candidatus Lumbricidiphila eiseniae TaxID=1969409 RepID=A0A2A6FNR1_9MICO|nr:MAG: hypothetical protein B5766_11720 [Candidatus Lumbricidophila eiseniae]